MTLGEGIRAVYDQVGAPDWAALNLDALADVLRDLSWLPEGPVEIAVPQVAGPDGGRLRDIVRLMTNQTADGPRPVRVRR
jgi:hypothetical protein